MQQFIWVNLANHIKISVYNSRAFSCQQLLSSDDKGVSHVVFELLEINFVQLHHIFLNQSMLK